MKNLFLLLSTSFVYSSATIGYRGFIFLITGLLLVTSCNQTPTALSTNGPPTISPTSTFTPPPPTPTPIPLVATVNGEGIPITIFQLNLDLFMEAQADPGTNLASDNIAGQVLDDLIDLRILAQAASETGYIVDDGYLAERITAIVDRIGGEEQLTAWMAAHGYSSEIFLEELRTHVAAAWMRDQISALVPETVEQVHARQILLDNSIVGQRVYDQLLGGASFDNLLAIHNPDEIGDLGWFPRGYLTEAEIEEAAFSLQPGEFSQVIETDIGYHIVQLIEYTPQRPLDPDALLVLRSKTVSAWLNERRNQSEIIILMPMP